MTARGRKPPSVKPPAPAAGPAQQLLQGYIDHLAHERRLAAHTTKNYRRDIEALLEFSGDRLPAELTVHDIRRCIAQLHGKGLDGRSLARMLSAWRGFYNYLVVALPSHKGDKLYHPLIGTKILLALGMFFIASALVGRSAKFEGMRRNSKFWQTMILILAAIIVGISGFAKVALKEKPPAVSQAHLDDQVLISQLRNRS